jgi:hypothetical protein
MNTGSKRYETIDAVARVQLRDMKSDVKEIVSTIGQVDVVIEAIADRVLLDRCADWSESDK